MTPWAGFRASIDAHNRKLFAERPDVASRHEDGEAEVARSERTRGCRATSTRVDLPKRAGHDAPATRPVTPRHKNGIRHRPQQHAANARRLVREHRADAYKGPRRAMPRPAFEPVHMAHRLAPSKTSRPSKACSTGAQAGAAVGRRSPPRPRATRRRPTYASYSPTTRSAAAYRSGRWSAHVAAHIQAEGNETARLSTVSGSSASTRRRSCRARRSSACSWSWRSARSRSIIGGRIQTQERFRVKYEEETQAIFT